MCRACCDDRVRGWADRRICAAALTLAASLGGAWWSAAVTMHVLHDDASLQQAVSATLDEPEVRQEIGDWLTAAVRRTSTVTGKDLARNPALAQLRTTLASNTDLAPMSDAITRVAVAARDRAVFQLDTHLAPKQAIRADVAPVFTAAGITIDSDAAKELGLRLDHSRLMIDVMDPEQLDRLQRRYDLTVLTDRWAGWAALALLAIALAASRRPLLTLTIAATLLVAAVVLVPIALGPFSEWSGRHALGPLVRPLTGTLTRAIVQVRIPVIIVGAAVVLACGAAHLAYERHRRSRADRAHAAGSS